MQKSNKTFVFILGAHRSGTSALARFMASMGVWLGPDLIEAKPDINEEGFWEHQGIVAINERILASLGSSWHDIRPLPENWWAHEALKDLREEAADLIKLGFSGHPLAGAKDPRFCRLLPFWAPILKELGWAIIAVNGYRNIISASRSLHKRDGFPDSLCKLIWLTHNVDMELNTRGIKSAFVEYDYFLEGPAKMAANLKAYFPEIPFSLPVNSSQAVNKSLRHHVITGEVAALDLSPMELLGEEISDNFRGPRSAEIRERMDHIRRSILGISGASPTLAAMAMEIAEGHVRANNKMIELGEMHAHAQRVVQKRDEQIQTLNVQWAEGQQDAASAREESSRLKAEVEALRNRVSGLVAKAEMSVTDESKKKVDSLSGYEKRVEDLQVTLEKRSVEMRAALVKIRDMQLEVDSCVDRVKAIEAESASKDALIAASEVIIKDQASLIDSRSKDIQESALLLSSLKRDIEGVGKRLQGSINRNHAIRNQMAIKERQLLSVNAELSGARQHIQKIIADNRFREEKEQYLDRMLLQISAELEDARKVSMDCDNYVRDMQSDIGRLNARISELHNEIIERDKNIIMLQEKFFYLRVRPLSRLLVRLGLYKVPHE